MMVEVYSLWKGQLKVRMNFIVLTPRITLLMMEKTFSELNHRPSRVPSRAFTGKSTLKIPKCLFLIPYLLIDTSK